MKTLALIKRRFDLSRDAFRDHYESVHAPLAIDTLLEGTARYVRYHLREVRFGAPAFDAVSAFWYRGIENALGVQRRLAGAEGERIARDERTFMDKAANTFFPVTEHPISGAEDPEAGVRILALVAAPDGEDAGTFVAAYEAERIPSLLTAMRSPGWCLQNRAIRIGEDRPAFDAVTLVHAAADAGLADWARELADTGARSVVVAVSEHESALPW